MCPDPGSTWIVPWVNLSTDDTTPQTSYQCRCPPRPVSYTTRVTLRTLPGLHPFCKGTRRSLPRPVSVTVSPVDTVSVPYHPWRGGGFALDGDLPP